MMLTFLIGLQIFLAILLVVIILLQNGKGADIGSAFGSGNNNGMLGPIESGTVLTTITWVLVFLFFINTLGISVYQKINLDTELEIFSEPLDVIDESHLHAGHVGARPEGETHFRLIISSKFFSGKTRIEKQRAIYRVLADELSGPVHALSIEAI